MDETTQAMLAQMPAKVLVTFGMTDFTLADLDDLVAKVAAGTDAPPPLPPRTPEVRPCAHGGSHSRTSMPERDTRGRAVRGPAACGGP